MKQKIKVVWLCHFSNEQIRSHLRFARPYMVNVIRKLLGYQTPGHSDFAVWNTNAVKEFAKYPDIDLTIIMPHYGISGRIQSFSIDSVKYVCYRSQDDHLLPMLKSKLFHKPEQRYEKNRKLIRKIIEQENPDIVHVVGAENPYYSIAALDMPDDIPLIVTLQTLMSDPNFFSNYSINKELHAYRADLEKQIICKSHYIGSNVESFKSIIWDNIKKDAIFLNISLAVGVEIDERPCKKEYDFVYFAVDISKACDYAIEAFGLANQRHPGITLNLSGGYSQDYKQQLDKRIHELGIQEKVFFTGPKRTHDEVIDQIKKSRFALLPLKVDLISGTIREAMACGLPVVTTVTPATPDLNRERNSVLLSEKGDFQKMADNMLKLLDDEDLATTIRKNAIVTVRERYSNEHFMQMWRLAYQEIIANKQNGSPFSEEIISRCVNLN